MSSGKGGLFSCFRQQDAGIDGGSTPRRHVVTRATKSPPKWHDCLAYEADPSGNPHNAVSGSQNAQVNAKTDELCLLLDGQDVSVTDCSPKLTKREPANRAELLATIKRLRRAAESQEELLANRSRQLYTKQQELEQLTARLAATEERSRALQDQLLHHDAATPRNHSIEPPPAPSTPPAGGSASASATPTPSPPTTPATPTTPRIPPATPLAALESSLSHLQQLSSQLSRCPHLTPTPLDEPTATPTSTSTLLLSTPTTPTPDPHIHKLVAMLDSQLRQHAQLLRSLLLTTPPGGPPDTLLHLDQDTKHLHAAPDAGGSPQQATAGGACVLPSDRAVVDAAAVAATASAALRQRDRQVAQLQQVRRDLEEELALERRRSELLQQQVTRLQKERAEKSSAACQVLEEELQEYQSMVDHLEQEHTQQARLLKDMAAKYNDAEATARQLKAEATKAIMAEEALRQEVAQLRVQVEQQRQQAQLQEQQQAEGLPLPLPSPEVCASPSKVGLVEGVDLEASVVKLVGQKVALEGQLRDSQHEAKLLRTQLAAAVARNRNEHRAWLAQTSSSMQQLEAMGAELRACVSHDRKRGAAAAAELRGGTASATSTPRQTGPSPPAHATSTPRQAPPPACTPLSPWSSSKSLKAPSPTPSPSPGALTNHRQSKSALSKSAAGKLSTSPFKQQPPWRTNTLTSKQRASTNSLPVSKPAAVWH